MLVPSRVNGFVSGSSVRLWNAEIRQLVEQNNFSGSLLRFRTMNQDGVRPDNFTFPLVLKSCAKLSNFMTSQTIHARAAKSPYYCDVFVQTTIIDMYIKCGRMDMAASAFQDTSSRDIATWNAMLIGFAQSGLFNGVVSIFKGMQFSAIVPDSVTIIGLSQAVASINDLELAKAVHSLGICIGADADISVTNTWISAYAKCGDLAAAESLFNSLHCVSRSIVSWNSLIAGYAHLQKTSTALNFYRSMIQNGFVPDSSTIVSLLSSFKDSQFLFYGMLIHCHAIKSGCDSCVSVTNTLISMYCNCGEIGSARCLFDLMPERSQVSWTVMISGYSENGIIDDAFNLFHAMKELPDSVTALSLISGCAKTGAIEAGKRIHSYAKCRGFEDNVQVCNALIDMYTKCGNMNQAWEVFSTMPKKTVVSWTTMLNGCALNGLYSEALTLFDEMVELGLEPNRITFLALLQACSHAGLLESGKKLFRMMHEVYRIEPGLDHYTCMIDLLSRKGRLDEAISLIHGMPMKADAAVWASLLCACKIHRNTEIGEYAASRLFLLDHYGSAPFVEMANIYASAGKWCEFINVRTDMRRRGLRKFPGRSTIEVDGQTHAFTVAEKDHCAAGFAYEALHWIDLQTRHNSSNESLSIFEYHMSL